MPNKISYKSKHFTLHKLTESAFAAIARDGGAAISNSGIIDLGGQLVVYDTFLTPQAAMDLRHVAEDLFGQTPQIVVNSHYHNDHIWGNQAFAPEAHIISSTHTRELIATAGMEEYQWYMANSAQRLESLQSQARNTEDEKQRSILSLWIGYYEGLVEAMPHLSVCMPNITFDHRFEIHGSKRVAELITFEGAHTGSDTVLYQPLDGLVFMSDLLFVGYHPYLADGDPNQLLKALKVLSQLKARYLIPGHGPVGNQEDLNLLSDYVNDCMETAQILVAEERANEDGITKLKIAEKYEHWQQSQFFYANIRFLCQYLVSNTATNQ